MPGRETFPRRERLTKSSEFRQVYEQGRKVVGRAFVCYVARGEGQGRRVGMAVSSKVGGAAARNRIKRYIREVYRTCRKDMDDDLRIVVVARPAASTLSYVECREAIGRLFRQGGALSE